MAITLDPILAEAQDSMERLPIVSLFATQVYEAMPFVGDYFNTVTDTERYTDLIKGEDGHLIGVYTNGSRIVLMHTDSDGIAWTATTTQLNTSVYGYQGIGIAEISEGVVGALFIDNNGLRSCTINESSGALIDGSPGDADIESFSPPEYITCVAVRKLQDGTFLGAYVVLNTELDTYTLYTRTSSDFITWGSSSTVPLTGLIADRPVDNVSLLQLSTGVIKMFFDYVDFERDEYITVSNIYSITSTDNGSTWGTPEQLTFYTEYGTSCTNPHASEKLDGSIALAYTDSKRVLMASDDTPMWDNVNCGTYDNTNAQNIHFDPATRRCYLTEIRTYVGAKSVCGVIVIDVDSWEVVEVYNAHTSPGYSTYYQMHHTWVGYNKGEGEFATFSSDGNIVLIDDKNKRVVEYHLYNLDSYEILANIDIAFFRTEFYGNPLPWEVSSTQVDAENRRLYVLFTCVGYFYQLYQIAYFDIDELPDASTGKYKCNTISSGSGVLHHNGGRWGLLLIRELNMICIQEVTGLVGYTQYPGALFLIDISSGGIIKTFTRTSHELFPLGGVKNGVYYDNHIYCSFPYTTVDNQSTRRGLCKINIFTEEITYHQPTYTTANDYGLAQKCTTGDGRILIAVGGGVASFEISSGGWVYYNGTSVPGFEPASWSHCRSVAYDELEKNILVGSQSTITTDAFVGLRMFNEEGSYNIGTVMYGEDGGDSWGEPIQMTEGHSAVDSAVVIDDDNVLWSIWTDERDGSPSTKWSKDIREMAIEDFIVDGKAVSVKWSLEQPTTLSFTLSHGHLFDKNNALSSWNNFIKKGKIIEVKFGETVNGEDYWQTQGTFIIDTAKTSYIKGQYPELTVTASSRNFVWSDIRIIASARYDSSNPEEMVTDLLTLHANMEYEDIDISTFPNRHDIHHQWVDTDLNSLLTELLSHFKSVGMFSVDDVYETKAVTTGGIVTHTYTGSEIIKFSPDDSFSSYTNKVIVNGESAEFIEVTYGEELIETVTGTAGWWESGNRKITVNYSEDREKVCYDPRMVVITDVSEFSDMAKAFGHATQYLSYEDPLNRYCEITVVLPGLMGALVALVGATLTLAYAAGRCTIDCGPYILGITVIQCAISYIVAQVCSYEYEIYAKPTGHEKQSVSNSYTDLPFLKEMDGLLITEEFEDPFCYTSQSCLDIATYEMGLLAAQRNRVSFEKIGHMKDEILDKIRIQHPHSKASMDVIITELTREFIKPASNVGNVASFVDKITGWVV